MGSRANDDAPNLAQRFASLVGHRGQVAKE